MGEKRIEWVDIYKGIAICLMVIGHVTGMFNQYIYQFHMAAFFLISGYTLKWEKRGIIKMISKKTYSLLIPYFSAFIYFLILDNILILTNTRQMFYDDRMMYISGLESIKQLIFHGNNYMWLLGAGWFVIVLFVIEIVHSVIAEVCKYQLTIYSIAGAVLYLAGYLLVKRGVIVQIAMFPIDLAFIGGGFYAVGVVFRRKNILTNVTKSKKNFLITFVASIVILYYLGNIEICTVNYPTRTFNSLFNELVAGVNGSIFLFCCSILIGKKDKIKSIFVYLGRNTLGIVFFHFQFFKLAFWMMYLCGIVEYEYMRNFLPTDEIGAKYWWLIAFVSVVASVLEWKILTSIKYIRVLFGKKEFPV